jgi:hypothetical protein
MLLNYAMMVTTVTDSASQVHLVAPTELTSVRKTEVELPHQRSSILPLRAAPQSPSGSVAAWQSLSPRGTDCRRGLRVKHPPRNETQTRLSLHVI